MLWNVDQQKLEVREVLGQFRLSLALVFAILCMYAKMTPHKDNEAENADIQASIWYTKSASGAWL